MPITCNGCGRPCPGSDRPTFRESRQVAKAMGWIKSGRRRRRRCPDCRAQREAVANTSTPSGGAPSLAQH